MQQTSKNKTSNHDANIDMNLLLLARSMRLTSGAPRWFAMSYWTRKVNQYWGHLSSRFMSSGIKRKKKKTLKWRKENEKEKRKT